MADSIDEFFAKKDKSKKGKAKAKYTTSETIAKKLEEGGKKPDPVPKKDNKDKIQINSNIQSIIIPSVANDQEDDEWKDIEETERDYTGLKIQALSISEREKEEEQLKEQMLSEQNGDNIKQGDGHTGPWKNVQKQVEPQPVEEEEPVVKEEPPKATGTYKPPALRNAPSGTVSSKRYPKNAPPISSELDFPSLSSAASEVNKWRLSEADNKNFQSVKHGVRSKGESQKEVQLDLENKFSALHQEK